MPKKRRATTVLSRNAGTWTESQYFSKIRSALRNAFRYWKPIQLAYEIASRPSQSSNKRLKKEYQCNHCKEWFPRKEVECDHIIECGSLKSLEEISQFIQRLSIEDISGFQILCKSKCHKEKTLKYKQQNQIK